MLSLYLIGILAQSSDEQPGTIEAFLKFSISFIFNGLWFEVADFNFKSLILIVGLIGICGGLFGWTTDPIRSVISGEASDLSDKAINRWTIGAGTILLLLGMLHGYSEAYDVNSRAYDSNIPNASFVMGMDLDGDGYSVSKELQWSTNPLDSDSRPPFWIPKDTQNGSG